MSKMVDPRTCLHFRSKDVCPNWDEEIMAYLDNRVISAMSLSFEPEMFDKAFEYCAHCVNFTPLSEFHDSMQTFH